MDLRMYFRVIWRFRLVVLVGFVLAVALALFSYFKFTSHGLTYRQGETWRASTTLIVNQASAPLGTPSGYSGPNGAIAYPQLAFYYAGLANSDAVQRIIEQRLHYRGIIQASPVIDQQTRITMPFIDLSGYASKPGLAAALVNAAAQALNTFVQQQEDAAGTPKQARVTLSQVNRAVGAALATGRRKTTPIVIFLTVMIAAVGLAFILENLRPRVQIVGRDVDDVSRRRSA